MIEKLQVDNKLSKSITLNIEMTQQKLAQELTRQFKPENEKMKEELCAKIQADVQNLNQPFNKLKKTLPQV